MGGDFNEVRFLGERRNCQRIFGSMRHFSDIIEDLELTDLPFLVAFSLGVVV